MNISGLKTIHRNRRSGHCFAFSPLTLVLFLGAGILYIIAPLATLIKILISGFKGLSALRDASTDIGGNGPESAVASEYDFEVESVNTDLSAAVCPVCATTLAKDDNVLCPRCSTPHHRDCWEYNEHCAVYGCGETVSKLGAIPVYRGRPHSSNERVQPPLRPLSAEFLSLRQRFRRWFWCRRIKWWSTLWFFYCLAYGILLHTISLGYYPFVGWIRSSAIVSAIIAGVLWIVCRILQYRLESSAESLPAVPPGRMAVLLNRLEKSESTPTIARVTEAGPYVYALFCAYPLLTLYPESSLGGSFYLLCQLLWGGFFVWMARTATRRHQATLQRIRCRLRSATKG